MLTLLIIIGAVMLVIESGFWIPPKKEAKKSDEKNPLLPALGKRIEETKTSAHR